MSRVNRGEAIFMTRRLTQKTALRPDDSPLFLSEEEVARLYGLSRSYLRKSRSEGVRFGRTPPPPYIRLEGRVLYPIVDMNEWYTGLPRFRSLAEEGASGDE
jgi:hypothetical protein